MSSSLLYVTEGFRYALYDPSDPDLAYQGPLRGDGWTYWLEDHPDLTFARGLVTKVPADFFPDRIPRPTLLRKVFDFHYKDLHKNLLLQSYYIASK